MKCISVWQPWASLLVLGLKRFETRHWPTNHRGPLAIHAAKRWTREEIKFQCHFVHLLRRHIGVDDSTVLAFEENPPLGAIVGVVNLVDCLPTSCISKGGAIFTNSWVLDMPIDCIEYAFGDFGPSRYGWKCERPIRFEEPIPMKGRQGLFELPDPVTCLMAQSLEGRTRGVPG